MGSSGIRIARVAVDSAGVRLDSTVRFVEKSTSRRGVVKAFREELTAVVRIGVSIAGPTDPSTGTVLFAGAYPWAKGHFGTWLTGKLDTPVAVINDAEAHLHAHTAGVDHPLVCLTLGTALGFAMSDADGSVRRPRPDTDWELGHVFITPPAAGADAETAAHGKVVWALGSRGLTDAQERLGAGAGAAAYVEQVAAFVYNVAMTFQPRTVVLAGGIAASLGDELVGACSAYLDRTWPPAVRWDPPSVLRTPYGADSGLVGAAVVAAATSTP